MMAHGIGDMLSDGTNSMKMAQQQSRKPTGVMGSRRIFAAAFKLKVLDSYRKDVDCRGNQRATARKYGIHRRQIQKWLQCEENLRSSCAENSSPAKTPTTTTSPVASPLQASPSSPSAPALNLSLSSRLHGDEPPPIRRPVHPPQHQRYTEYPEAPNKTTAVGETERKYFVLSHGSLERPRFNYHQLPYQSSMVSLHHTELLSPTIKSEPASPDSAAPSSPAMSTTTASTHLYNTDLQVETGMEAAVHFPAHVYDSEKSTGQLERVVKKEILEEEVIAEEKSSLSYEGSERSIAASPRVISSSSSGNSSCSDSEIDPLDYNSSPQNIPSDMLRRRSFSLRFKLDVLDAFHADPHVAGNQRATARKFGINRRQVQKWLGQESELRGEIALRGSADVRQRLGSLQDVASEAPVDLRTATSPVYCCDQPTQRLGYYTTVSDVCTHSCCTDEAANIALPVKNCYPDAIASYYCYSTKESVEMADVERSSGKRSAFTCDPGCYYNVEPYPKRFCVEEEPQERPLCLVVPKISNPDLTTSIVPNTPAKKDVILFKPYLDNPINKPGNDEVSPKNYQVINNNCPSTCNLNEQGHDYSLQLKFRVPTSWNSLASYPDAFSEGIRSAFVRYPSSTQHYA